MTVVVVAVAIAIVAVAIVAVAIVAVAIVVIVAAVGLAEGAAVLEFTLLAHRAIEIGFAVHHTAIVVVIAVVVVVIAVVVVVAVAVVVAVVVVVAVIAVIAVVIMMVAAVGLAEGAAVLEFTFLARRAVEVRLARGGRPAIRRCRPGSELRARHPRLAASVRQPTSTRQESPNHL